MRFDGSVVEVIARLRVHCAVLERSGHELATRQFLIRLRPEIDHWIHRGLHCREAPSQTRSAPSSSLTAIPCVLMIRSLCQSLLLSERSEEHTSELQSLRHLVCRLLLEKKKNTINN